MWLKRWRGIAMARWCTAITIAICIGSLVAITTIVARVAIAQDAGTFAIVFGGWALSPYVALLTTAAVWRRRRFASAAITICSALITFYGLRLLYHDLSFYFEPLSPGSGNCAGPI